MFVQFFLILGFTALFLFTQANYEIIIKWVMAGFIVWSVAQLGILMENRNGWVKTEYIRLLFIGAMIFFFFPSWISAVLGIVLFSAFAIWLHKASTKNI